MLRERCAFAITDRPSCMQTVDVSLRRIEKIGFVLICWIHLQVPNISVLSSRLHKIAKVRANQYS